jgi:hypothetical protein
VAPTARIQIRSVDDVLRNDTDTADDIPEFESAPAKNLQAADLKENIRGGAVYLKQLLGRFDNDLVLTLAAYNAGPAAVQKYGGVPPYQETQEYVQRVLYYSGQDPDKPARRSSPR